MTHFLDFGVNFNTNKSAASHNPSCCTWKIAMLFVVAAQPAPRNSCAAAKSRLCRHCPPFLFSSLLFFPHSPSSPLHGHMAFRTVSDGLDTRRRTRMTCQHMHTHWPPQLFVSQGSRIIVGYSSCSYVSTLSLVLTKKKGFRESYNAHNQLCSV